MAYGVGREMLMLCNYMYFESRRILQLKMIRHPEVCVDHKKLLFAT